MEHFFVRKLIGPQGTGGNIQLHQAWIETILKHVPRGPIIFRIDRQSSTVGDKIFCGINDWHNHHDYEGCGNRIVYLPEWMIIQLDLEINDIIRLVPIQIPTGNYLKIRVSNDLTTMIGQKEFLESQLKNFTCLSKNQELILDDHYIYVVDVGINKDTPSIYDTICIVNVDLEVELDPLETDPTGGRGSEATLVYRDPVDLRDQVPNNSADNAGISADNAGISAENRAGPNEFKPFSGRGYRLSDN